jgi:3-oxosteroid 1-dehydrogenase
LSNGVVAHDHGLKVLIVEKEATIRGTTAESAGTLWAPQNPFMKAAGFEDSREKALGYLQFMGGGDAYTKREDMEWYVDNVPRTITYFHDKAELAYRVCEMPEFFYPEAPGSMSHGRSLIYEPFPAETLGAWRDKVETSSWHHGLSEALVDLDHNPSLGGMIQKDSSDGPQIGYSGPVRGDEKKIALWRKHFGSKVDAMLKKDEEHRVAGAALLAYVFRAVLKRGIEVRTETPVERLLIENDRVVGVIVRHGGGVENIRTNRGVVLSTGGGNGVYLAASAGASLGTEAGMPGPILRIQVPGENDRHGRPISRGNYEQRMRHSLVVNKYGERFGNETRYEGLPLNHFDPFGTHRFRNIPDFYIFDSQLLQKYSFVGLPPGATDEGLDWVTKASTLAELAQKLKLPASKLEATVTRFNGHATTGKDSDFGRGAQSLGRLEKPPFYGIELPSIDPLAVGVTVIVNRSSQVISHETKTPIPGLYAVGPMGLIKTNQIWGIGYQAGFDLMYIAIASLSAGEHVASAAPVTGHPG